MNAIRLLTLSSIALVAIIFLNPAAAAANTCSASSECTAAPSPMCDGNTAVRYAHDGTCADTDYDGTLDECSYAPEREECGNGVCDNGFCISVSRPSSTPPVPDTCDIDNLSSSSCDASGTSGTLKYFEEIAGGCVEQSVTITCGNTQHCAQFDEHAIGCVDNGMFITNGNQPDDLGSEDGVSYEQWETILSRSARFAHHAANQTCHEMEGTDTIRCGRVFECFNLSGEEQTECYQRAIDVLR